ncbi:MAG: M48 family metallopeptidase [Pseudomonadota bacterium]|nr:M48 family metallopeptidase [Pseudomonadota bacterium]
MTSLAWTALFAAALVVSLALRLWLIARQVRHVALHRDEVPLPFRASVPIEAHRKAAAYTVAKARVSSLQAVFGGVVVLGWTLFGGLDSLDASLRESIVPRLGGLAYELSLLAAFAFIGALLELPFELFSTFVIEERFGFNRTRWTLWLADAAKGLLLAVAIGLPLLTLILWLMGVAGNHWWWLAWMVWAAFNLLAMWLGPTLIAPLFNRFEPLADAPLNARVQALLARAGLALQGLFVMDGSRRTAHANAYFTGFGRAKRVVFFDTLLARLDVGEVEAVLAHELGHYARRHLRQRIVWALGIGLAVFALLGALSTQLWFYRGLGVTPSLSGPNDALTLLLFVLVAPVFGSFIGPLFAQQSRRHEFEADAYACANADRNALAGALLKLHQDNASTLTPDPIFARFYYSHPPAVERLAALGAVV